MAKTAILVPLAVDRGRAMRADAAMKRDDADEVDRNYRAFLEMLPELLRSHPGKFALMSNAKIVDFFSTLSDAVRAGKEKFGDHHFSVQEVTSQNVNLGFYSYALHQLPG